MFEKIKVAVLSSNDISPDPRITRSMSFLKKKYRVGAFCFVWPYRGQKPYEKKGDLEIFRFLYQELPLSSWYKKLFVRQRKGRGPTSEALSNVKSNAALGKISYLYNFFYFNRKLAKEAIKFNPDIVHANDFDTLWAGYLIKKATGAKLVYDAHEIWSRQGQDLPKLFLKLFEKMEKSLLGKIDAFITVNESLKAELQRYYQTDFKRIFSETIYNAPRYQNVNRNNFVKFKGKTIIFYHGGYMANRGLEELVLAAKYLKYPAVMLLRLTSKPSVIVNLISKEKLNDKVIIIPPVSMSEMVARSSGAEIGVVPYKPANINNLLSLPNKVFEYQMADMALAVSDLPELKKIVKKYKNGATFNPAEPKNIAQKLNELLKNKQKLQAMRRNSKKAAKILNFENEEKKLNRLYEKLLAKN